MAYPSGITTFPTRNNGDTIDASHIDNVQTEITAIETDLVSGFTGKLTANNGAQFGNSTVNHLQVGGDSTFASSTQTISTQTYVWPSSRASVGDILTVASTSGSTAVLQWQQGITRPVCLVRHSAVTEIAGNVWTGLNWDTEDADASGMHSTSANSSRITFALSSGLYQVGLSVQFGGGANSTFFQEAVIRLNDTHGLVGASPFYPTASADKPVTVTGLVNITSTSDYITAVVFPGTGSTGRILDSTASTQSSPSFWAHKVG